jgi:hypothetical protein
VSVFESSWCSPFLTQEMKTLLEKPFVRGAFFVRKEHAISLGNGYPRTFLLDVSCARKE